MVVMDKTRAPRNRTITLTESDIARYQPEFLRLHSTASVEDIRDRIICQDVFEALQYFPSNFVDLLFADPPYNLTKTFNSQSFQQRSLEAYGEWLDSWLSRVIKVLKPSASIYLCGDWRSSAAIHRIGAKYFNVQNRITWEREKGRGARSNWKNSSEDIWFFTKSDKYTFNVDAVMMKRQVIAPYTDEEGRPKDWDNSHDGRFRLTYPSNLWTDLTVPFWSMSENTDHPTQKPEKLLAKIILASTNEGDTVFDPFQGSGTTSVVAKKLRRGYVGIELDNMYCCLAQKRIELASHDPSIQGYADGVFWERNTLSQQPKEKPHTSDDSSGLQQSLL